MPDLDEYQLNDAAVAALHIVYPDLLPELLHPALTATERPYPLYLHLRVDSHPQFDRLTLQAREPPLSAATLAPFLAQLQTVRDPVTPSTLSSTLPLVAAMLIDGLHRRLTGELPEATYLQMARVYLDILRHLAPHARVVCTTATLVGTEQISLRNTRSLVDDAQPPTTSRPQ